MLMLQWKQLQEANRAGIRLKQAQAVGQFMDAGTTPASNQEYVEGGQNPGVLKRDPNAPEKGRGEYSQIIFLADGTVAFGDTRRKKVFDAAGNQITDPEKLKGAKYNPSLQGDLSLATTLGTASGKNLESQHKQALDAENSLRITREARKLLDAGMTTGKFADFKVGFATALQSAGFNVAKDPTENTQAFISLMGTQVANIIKAFGTGTGLSDADRDYAIGIAGGKIALNEGSIRHILELNDKASQFILDRYEKTYNDLQTRFKPPGMAPPKVPAAEAGPSAGPKVRKYNPQTGQIE